jgi:hypothetical protein
MCTDASRSRKRKSLLPVASALRKLPPFVRNEILSSLAFKAMDAAVLPSFRAMSEVELDPSAISLIAVTSSTVHGFPEFSAFLGMDLRLSSPIRTMRLQLLAAHRKCLQIPR